MALTKVTGSVIKDSVSLSGNVSVGGTLTYQDVTNVDALGVGTFRTGIKVLAGQVDVGSNIKLGNAGVITATSFSGVMSGTTGSFSGQVNVGSNIKLGTAGVVTATSFVGSGAQLTNLPAQATIANNADNRVITGGSGVNLNGEANLTFNGSNLQFNTTANGHAVILKSTGNHYTKLSFDSNNTSAGGELAYIDFSWDGDKVADIFAEAGSDTTNKDDGHLVFRTSPQQGNITERLRIKSDGKIGIGTNNPTEILNIYGTNVKPVIGDRTAHTPHYASYDSQNNTTLEITSSGTGTNVAGLAINNPTTSANSSYKTLTFCCSGTSSGEKRGAIISSNHDAASGSAIKGNLTTMVNNGSGLQTAMFIGHQGHVTKARTAMFSARGQGSWNTFNSGSGWYNLGDSSFSGSNYYINHSWTTSGGACGVRGVTDAGNSIWENDKARFTAPVAGFYFFEISMYIRAFGGGKTFHVQPWLDSSNLNYYTSNIGNIRNSSNSLTGNTQEYPNSVVRSIVLSLAAGQQFRWSVYSEGTSNFTSHFDYAHQSGYLIG